jgi:hypothetical protein
VGWSLTLETENIVVEASHENMIPIQIRAGGCIMVIHSGVHMDTQAPNNFYNPFSLNNDIYGYGTRKYDHIAG